MNVSWFFIWIYRFFKLCSHKKKSCPFTVCVVVEVTRSWLPLWLQVGCPWVNTHLLIHNVGPNINGQQGHHHHFSGLYVDVGCTFRLIGYTIWVSGLPNYGILDFMHVVLSMAGGLKGCYVAQTQWILTCFIMLTTLSTNIFCWMSSKVVAWYWHMDFLSLFHTLHMVIALIVVSVKFHYAKGFRGFVSENLMCYSFS